MCTAPQCQDCPVELRLENCAESAEGTYYESEEDSYYESEEEETYYYDPYSYSADEATNETFPTDNAAVPETTAAPGPEDDELGQAASPPPLVGPQDVVYLASH